MEVWFKPTNQSKEGCSWALWKILQDTKPSSAAGGWKKIAITVILEKLHHHLLFFWFLVLTSAVELKDFDIYDSPDIKAEDIDGNPSAICMDMFKQVYIVKTSVRSHLLSINHWKKPICFEVKFEGFYLLNHLSDLQIMNTETQTLLGLQQFSKEEVSGRSFSVISLSV